LAIITSHPIQYNAPLFKLLTDRKNIEIKVFYSWGSSVLENRFDPGFGKIIDWDIPLLNGYEYEFVHNTAKDKGSHHFNGIVNPDIINKIEGWSADAVLVFGWNFHSHLRVIRYFNNKIPVLFRGDSTLLDENNKFSPKKIARFFFLKWLYRHIDKAFYVGVNNKKYYRKFGLREDQLIIAPHAIDNSRFADADGSYSMQAKEWRRRLGIHDDNLVFVFAGKLEPKKDPELLLQAFLELSFADAHLIFVGNGVLEKDLKKKASSNPNVHFIDFQNQTLMPVVYRLADMFVLPSKGPGETWGLALNEAMACGKPVIASDKTGGAVDLIGDGNYIFKAGDISSLKEVLTKTYSSKLLLKKMGEKNLDTIQNFNFESIARAIELAA
jgi:glycosyltransferase involved in cell wall biosynthesis